MGKFGKAWAQFDKFGIGEGSGEQSARLPLQPRDAPGPAGAGLRLGGLPALPAGEGAERRGLLFPAGEGLGGAFGVLPDALRRLRPPL